MASIAKGGESKGMQAGPSIRQAFLDDEGEPFEVMIIECAHPRASLLFGVGAGGDPERHLPLLMTLAERGSTVAAPHFERMQSLVPTVADLETRARRQQIAFNEIVRDGLPGAGLGHSIGAAMMLMLAGATAWTMPGRPARIAPEPRLQRLALLAPAAAFFRGSRALDQVRVPTHAWVGGRDSMTPPPQAQFVKDKLAGKAEMEISVIAEAGHFSFMNVPPPHAVETLPDRDAFLQQLADEVASFILG